MSRIIIESAGDGFRWRFTSGNQKLSYAGGPFATQDEATREAYYFRQSVTIAPVVSMGGEVLDAPLTVDV